MCKLARCMFVSTLLFMAGLALVFPSSTPVSPEVQAAGDSCDLIGALCRLTSSTDYQICLINGGGASDCAWAEAQQTINCLTQAGCPLNN